MKLSVIWIPPHIYQKFFPVIANLAHKLYLTTEPFLLPQILLLGQKFILHCVKQSRRRAHDRFMLNECTITQFYVIFRIIPIISNKFNPMFSRVLLFLFSFFFYFRQFHIILTLIGLLFIIAYCELLFYSYSVTFQLILLFTFYYVRFCCWVARK